MRLLILALFALFVTSPVQAHVAAATADADIRLEQSAAADEEDVTSGSDDMAVRSGSDTLAIGLDRSTFAAGDVDDDSTDASGTLSADGGFNLAPAR